MFGREDEAGLQTDAYIEALLARHARRPVVVTAEEFQPPPATRRAVDVLAAVLPRFHPSFRFEEELATRLRGSALRDAPESAGPRSPADVIVLPSSVGGGPLEAVPAAVGGHVYAAALGERRLLLGGAALASGVSLAGAAMLAWRRRERGRFRRTRSD